MLNIPYASTGGSLIEVLCSGQKFYA
ncbi:hypothetical protein A2U01_0116798, partial [Trifolium medium]|nr:hypothetical protein [Trifolium medium]